MSDNVRSTARELLRTPILAAQADGVGAAPTVEQIPVEYPKRAERGDCASNVALAKQVGKLPRVLREAIAKYVRRMGDASLPEVMVAGPGFINLRFSDTSWVEAIRDVLERALSLLGVSAPQEMKRAESSDGAEEP
jgi:arginyl-tRNA synthetase